MINRVDNVGEMFLGNNAVLSQQSKHISIRHHYIRQHIEDGKVKIVFIKSKLKSADVLTKNPSQELFIRHVNNIMNGGS